MSKRERTRNTFISLTLSACSTIWPYYVYLIDQLSHPKIRMNSQDSREQDCIMTYVDWADIDEDLRLKVNPRGMRGMYDLRKDSNTNCCTKN